MNDEERLRKPSRDTTTSFGKGTLTRKRADTDILSLEIELPHNLSLEMGMTDEK